MIKSEAERIAGAVSMLRPDWSIPLLMAVLGDRRMINRPYADAAIAMVALATDPTTTKPGRIHESGRWWQAVTAVTQGTPQIRAISPDDCDICTKPRHMHPIAPTDDHEWMPRRNGRGDKPTPEQRVEIDKANAEAQALVTAAKEAAKTREVSSVDEVLARHANQEDE